MNYEKTKDPNMIKKIELEKEIAELVSELNDLVSDKELLEWARDNHPSAKEKMQLEKEIELRHFGLEELK